ncbi:MAG: WG repeat-containing protein [Oscillospiraceae bacterium]|nr:WG repeat-containing protein [Oscillospiraceae bacterium]
MMKRRLINAVTAFAAAFTMTISFVSAPSAAAKTAESNTVIVVSLGDSYSSGEGIEPFYGQKKADGSNNTWEYKSEIHDWQAHRSTLSWPAQIVIPGIEGTMRDYKADNEDSHDSDVCKWYFRAVSGAETKHLNESQLKPTKKDLLASKVDHDIPAQLTVFDKIEKYSTDYVTMSLGGNDVDFVGVVRDCVLGSTYLSYGTSMIENRFEQIWSNWEKDYKNRLRNAYLDTRKAAGEQAYILVVGYPRLFDETGKGALISKEEAQRVNANVTAFNTRIKFLVEGLDDDHFVFVDVEKEFSKDGGHGAYSDDQWINEIILGTRSEDLEHPAISSSYSMHPNKEGAQAYARCVNQAIAEIESARKTFHEECDSLSDAFDWEVYPEIKADDIIVGDNYHIDYSSGTQKYLSSPYVYIRRGEEPNASYGLIGYDGKYGLMSDDKQQGVEPTYNCFNGDKFYGLDDFIAVYDGKSGYTVFSEYDNKSDEWKLKAVENASGTPGIGTAATTYFIDENDGKLYRYNELENQPQVIEEDPDTSYVVQKIDYVPSKYGLGKSSTDNELYYLYNNSLKKTLTEGYRHVYANRPYCKKADGLSGEYTTVAFSNDGTKWDIYDYSGNLIASGLEAFDCNDNLTPWWKPVTNFFEESDEPHYYDMANLYACSMPFCSTEGYIAAKIGGKCGYLDMEGNETVKFGVFEDVRPVHNGKAWVKYDGRWGVISFDENNLFSILPEKFVFSSGVGGWGTEIAINEDGSFTGEYHDSELGMTGEGNPNGTVYICEFTGKFKNVRKIDEYTYSMELDHLNYDGSHSYIKDGVEYIYSTPVGLEKADELMVYLPGKPMNSIPEDFKSWMFALRRTDSDVLPDNTYGIFNVVEKTGFISMSK